MKIRFDLEDAFAVPVPTVLNPILDRAGAVVMVACDLFREEANELFEAYDGEMWQLAQGTPALDPMEVYEELGGVSEQYLGVIAYQVLVTAREYLDRDLTRYRVLRAVGNFALLLEWENGGDG